MAHADRFLERLNEGPVVGDGAIGTCLHNEVPGIRLPDPLLARLAAQPDPADQQRAAIERVKALQLRAC